MMSTITRSMAALAFSSVAFSQTITLSVKGGPPTGTTVISGSGFSAHAAIDIYFDVTDEFLVIASASGAFSGLSLEVPASALPGKHWVTAVQRTSGTGVQMPFSVFSNWGQFRFTPTHKAFDPYENLLSPSSVGALDKQWSYATQAGVISAPAIVNGVVYAASKDNYVYALKASTGALLWKFPTGASIQSSPAVVNGVVYVGSFDNSIYALNATTGAPLWTYATQEPGGVYASPTVANGIVYVGSGPQDFRPERHHRRAGLELRHRQYCQLVGRGSKWGGLCRVLRRLRLRVGRQYRRLPLEPFRFRRVCRVLACGSEWGGLCRVRQ